MVIRTLRLDQIYNIEFVGGELLDVLDSEIEPLSEGCRHVIVFKYQVVFVVSDLDRSSQVARLESALENQSVIVITLLSIEWPQFGIVTIDFWHFLVEGGGLAGWTVRVVLPVVNRVLLWWQLDEIALVDVWSALGIFLLRRIVEAIVHNLFSLILVHAPLSIDTRVLFAHG